MAGPPAAGVGVTIGFAVGLMVGIGLGVGASVGVGLGDGLAVGDTVAVSEGSADSGGEAVADQVEEALGLPVGELQATRRRPASADETTLGPG
ncbi:MAG: hypothetical protein ABI978_01525 [Chloroflexota bacterium]